jgi:HAD superfamily hydrolase (TIGR01549 family)
MQNRGYRKSKSFHAKAQSSQRLRKGYARKVFFAILCDFASLRELFLFTIVRVVHDMNHQSLDRKSLKALLFDLDGTLLDSFSAHLEAYRIMFGRFGIEITKESFLSSYSPNWYETYHAMGLPKETWELANAYWLEAAAQQTPNLFPGVEKILLQLAGLYKLGLVTSGSKSRVVRDLERTGIKTTFETVITGDDVQQPKPAPEGLEMALARLEVQPHEAVYIGDAQADYEMAHAAKVQFVGVRSAFDSLKAIDSCIQVEKIADIVALFV